MTFLLADAEHILELGVRRAVSLIREGRVDDARRALLVAGSAAELIQESEAEMLT